MSSSTVYKLNSDNQFIRTSRQTSDNILVWEFPFNLNRFDFSKADCSKTIPVIEVGPSPWSQFMALEVWGVKIEGDQIRKLNKDLALYDGQPFHLWVNRQGLCHLRLQNEEKNMVKRVRINDCFVWSKYGVKVPESRKTTWRAFDIINGDTLFAPRRIVDDEDVYDVDDDDDDDDEDGLGGKWKKVAKEKEKEVASLKVALRALTLMICDK